MIDEDRQAGDERNRVVTVMFAPPPRTTFRDARVIAAEQAITRALESAGLGDRLGVAASEDGPFSVHYRVRAGQSAAAACAVAEATCALLDAPHTVGLEDECALAPADQD